MNVIQDPFQEKGQMWELVYTGINSEEGLFNNWSRETNIALPQAAGFRGIELPQFLKEINSPDLTDDMGFRTFSGAKTA